MNEISISKVLESKYNGSITLMNAINDPLISENLENFYVPQVEVRGSTFIKKDESVAVTDEGPKKICFIYMNQYGKNITNPDSSFIQIPANNKGFLARLSISRNYYTPENLQLDYLIDISDIRYRIDSVMFANEGNILASSVIHFDNVDFTEYQKVQFDQNIKDFVLHRDELFSMYF